MTLILSFMFYIQSTHSKMNCKWFVSHKEVNIDPFKPEPQVLMVILQLTEEIPSTWKLFCKYFYRTKEK